MSQFRGAKQRFRQGPLAVSRPDCWSRGSGREREREGRREKRWMEGRSEQRKQRYCRAQGRMGGRTETISSPHCWKCPVSTKKSQCKCKMQGVPRHWATERESSIFLAPLLVLRGTCLLPTSLLLINTFSRGGCNFQGKSTDLPMHRSNGNFLPDKKDGTGPTGDRVNVASRRKPSSPTPLAFHGGDAGPD